MKFLILTLALASAYARPDVSHVVSNEKDAAVLKYEVDVNPDGFQYGYETSNGIAAQAAGVVKPGEYPALEEQGSFRYPSPDGSVVELSYLANENGFQPQGSHLPTPPPIPEAILRGLEYLARNARDEPTFKQNKF